jgi:hypothetical protein
MTKFSAFLKDEAGAVTVDWVVLTAAVVASASSSSTSSVRPFRTWLRTSPTKSKKPVRSMRGYQLIQSLSSVSGRPRPKGAAFFFDLMANDGLNHWFRERASAQRWL